MFLALLVFSYHTIASQETSLIKKMVHDSLKDSEVIKSAIWNRMMTKEREGIHQIIRAIGKTEGFKEINIYDHNGFLHYSTGRMETPFQVELAGDPLLNDLTTNPNIRHRISPDGSTISVVNPLINTTSCSSMSCHAPPGSEIILGAIELKIGLEKFKSEISLISRKTVIFATVLFLASCSISGLAVLVFVNPSIKNLREKASRMARGDYVPGRQEMGQDEIADLARAFDSMSVQINQRTFELQASRKRYKALFEEVPCYLTVIDKNFRIVRSNRSFRAEFGDKTGAYCFASYKNQSTQCKNCPVEKTFLDGTSHQSEEMWSINGLQSNVIVKTSPIFDDTGKVNEVLEMVVDVTLLKRLQFKIERQRQEFQNLFENVPCYLTVVDKDFNILRHNIAFSSDFGFSEGKKCYEVYKHNDRVCNNCPVQKTFENGESAWSEEVWRKNGDDTYIVVNTSPVRNDQGEITAVMEMSTNITEIKRLQGELVILGETIAGMSHSIKNILAGLQGGVYVLDSGLIRGRDDRVKAGWDMVKTNVEKISDLVKGILYASKERSPEYRPYDVGQLLTEVCDLYEAKAKDEGVAIVRKFETKIRSCMMDPASMHSALSNLVSNGIYACRTSDTETNGQLIVNGSIVSDRLVIEISDNGVGMSEEIRNNLFSKFYSTKGSQGTGLGLVITKKVIHEHKGTIKVESQEGEGSKFIVEIPLHETPILDNYELQEEKKSNQFYNSNSGGNR